LRLPISVLILVATKVAAAADMTSELIAYRP
jgi:hypothetical protein